MENNKQIKMNKQAFICPEESKTVQVDQLLDEAIKFPVSNNKVPLVKQWQKLKATVEGYRDVSSYGLLTGKGFIVVDVDIKNGKDGRNWEWYEELPTTYTVRTPSGGFHFYYALPQDFTASTNHMFTPIGVEIQGDGAYVVGVGSTGYSKEGDIKDVVLAPSWLLELVTKENTKPKVDKLKPKKSRVLKSLDAQASDADCVRYSKRLWNLSPDKGYDQWRNTIWSAMYSGIPIETIQEWCQASTLYDWAEASSTFYKVVSGYDAQRACGESLENTLTDKTVGFGSIPLVANNVVDDIEIMVEGAISGSREQLERHGNKLTDNNIKDLETLSRAIIHGAICKDKFRLTMPLYTGFGKTTCMKHSVIALKDTSHSIVIATETIKELKPIYKELKAADVNVGAYFKKQEDDFDPIEESEVENTQVLLIAHAMITQGKRIDYNKYKGRKRDLVIWDEVLQTGRGDYLTATKLMSDIGGWINQYSCMKIDNPKAITNPTLWDEIYHWVEDTNDRIKKAMINGEEIVELRYLTIENKRLKQVFNCLEGDLGVTIYSLAKWASHYDNRIRLVKGNNGTTAVQAYVSVPDTVDKIINLDAGVMSNLLVAMDNSIKALPVVSKKDFSKVLIKHMNVLSSRSAIKQDTKAYVKEVVDYIQSLCIDDKLLEDVLILAFKEESWKKLVYEELSAKGIDRYKVHYLTYGAHKAINEYSDVKHIITFGVLYRNLEDMKAQLIAQSRDKELELSDVEAKGARDSEQAQLLYQALSRGHCRKQEDGYAGDTTILLILPSKESNTLRLLQELMPNVALKELKPNRLAIYSKGQDEEDLVDDIVGYLSTVKDKDAVSFTSTKKAVCPELKGNNRLWKKARGKVDRESFEWSVVGLSFVRNNVHSSALLGN